MFKDSLFNKIEKKTNVNKDTIIKLANRLQQNNLKDEKTIRDVIKELSTLTGKNITKETIIMLNIRLLFHRIF